MPAKIHSDCLLNLALTIMIAILCWDKNEVITCTKIIAISHRRSKDQTTSQLI